MPRVVVLGSHSFYNSSVKVGIQFIAEGLARRGWQVDYLSAASSPIDLISRTRRWRWREAWARRTDLRGIEIAPNLTEYIMRAPFPVRKSVLRWEWQARVYPILLPERLRERIYDLCITETGSTILFLPSLRAKTYVWRLSDLPRGFSYNASPLLAEVIEKASIGGLFKEIWAVSQPLADYARRLGVPNGTNIIVIPNGVDTSSFLRDDGVSPKERMPRSAVFVGSIEEWTDVELVDKTASLLPDWKFDFYGPLHRPWRVVSPNLRYLGPVSHEKLPDVLTRYEVGLIPFRDVIGRLEAVERPLKFYEYLSSGLGIASTDVGGLRRGMGSWAFYGNTPEAYAKAIKSAASHRLSLDQEEVLRFLSENSWESVIGTMVERLNAIVRSSQS